MAGTVFGIFLGLQFLTASYGAMFKIFWNTTNPIFRIDNTDHVFTAKIRDRVNILCPLYNDTVLEDQTEQSIIYMVSKFGYENCILDGAKPVGQCTSPYFPSKITVVLREFTPSPSKLEFTPGESFYFISTSSGSKGGISERKGGLCLKQNLKVRLDILPIPGRVSATEKPIDAENELAGNRLSPRWRSKLLPSVPKPEQKPVSVPTREPDLNEFFEKLNRERSQQTSPSGETAPFNESPDWWNPNSAPEEEPLFPINPVESVVPNSVDNYRDEAELSKSAERFPLYEIHPRENEEQLVFTRYYGPMADEGRAGGSDESPTNEQLVLYAIGEEDHYMNSGSPVSVRWKLFSGCLLSLLISFFFSWRR